MFSKNYAHAVKRRQSNDVLRLLIVVIALFILVSESLAQPALQAQVPVSSEADRAAAAAVLDNSKVDRQGSIADTNADKIISKQAELRPEFGFEDVFMTPKSDTVIDVHKLGVDDTAQLCLRVTQTGIVVNGQKDQSGGQRVFVGDKQGITQILIYSGKAPECVALGPLLKVYRITVSGQDLVGLLQHLKALLGDVEGLEMRIVGNQVVLDGKVLVPADVRRIRAVLAKQQGKPILSLYEISPVTLKLVAEKMQEEINGGKDRAPEVKVKVVNGRYFLDGIVDKEIDRQVAQKICQSYLPPKFTLEPDGSAPGKLETPAFTDLAECVSMVRIRGGQAKDPDPIISVRVDFVTLNKNYSKNFDFSWAPGISTGDDSNVKYSSDTGNFLTTFTGTLKNLFPKLNNAKSHGYARVLKTATVLVRDGDGADGQPTEASINETINIGYVIPATATQPASPGNTPVITEIKVRARSIPGSDKINLGISATQAEISARRTDGPPDTLQNKVDTQIVVPNNDSAAVGGLIAERRTTGFGREPSSDNDFKVFNLDRKMQFSDNKGQFIIFVTPTKLRSTTEGTDALKRKFRLRK